MSISNRDILFRCGAADLLRYGRLTRLSWPEELTAIQPQETFTRSTIKRVFGANGVLYGVGVNVPAIDYVDANTPTLLLEPQRTNVVLWNRDLTNVAWTKTSCTAVKDQGGLDALSSTASKLTATGANGTCLQAITLASSSRVHSAYVRRLTGTGTVQMTQDNGGTWTTIVLTPGAGWVRYTIPIQTIANPTVGFRIVTSGDAIAVDYVQNEAGQGPTSPIEISTGTVTRAADSLTFPYPHAPQGPVWWYAKLVEAGAVLGLTATFPTVMTIGTYGAPPNWRQHMSYTGAGGHYSLSNGNNVTFAQSGAATDPTVGQVVELLGVIFADGSVKFYQSIAGAADTASTTSAAVAMPNSFLSSTLSIGDGGVYAQSILRAVSLKVGRGIPLGIPEIRAIP